MMDTQAFSYIHELMKTALEAGDPRAAIENFLSTLRPQFVFDNVAVYLYDERINALEIAYARALGRAKTAEADAAWGETFAGKVMGKGKVLLQDPASDVSKDDRLQQAYLLGIPLRSDGLIAGALVFVRFGGPPYDQSQVVVGSLVGEILSVMFERQTWKRMHEELRELKLQMQLQEDFVSTISHELRTPLGFIKGYSTSLLRKDTSWDQETQQEFLTIIDEEADRLSRLIENVLEAARLQSRTLPLRFQPLRLDAVIRDVATRMRSRYKELNVQLELEPAPPIQGDGVRIAQVFDNLFMNAIKYAPGSPIQVDLQQKQHYLRVSITDQGPGIPEEALSLIFERFYRVRTEKITGSGLGLYICKQIVEAHRGKIWAESTFGKGTTFFIELPINPAY
ncbi:MAG TPA: ATP-binding protein [Anaerolineales bacterium]|nr:ATP-binding protein [Anaerolineales bacterium]